MDSCAGRWSSLCQDQPDSGTTLGIASCLMQEQQAWDSLLAKLSEVRALGYARVHVADERDHHIVSVSMGDPVHAGIAMSGWIPEGATAPLVEALREAAQRIGE